MNNDIKSIVEICDVIGSKCFVVGGAVIDLLQGNEVKDWDIEVYGRTFEQIVGKLLLEGFRVSTAGKNFGIVKVSCGGLDIDLSIPRRENRIGVGHKDFNVEFCSDIKPIEAARRRDFTINAMMYDVSNFEAFGEFDPFLVIDFFGGRLDLEDGALKAIDPRTFVEDPLRVLRAMQLVARKGRFVGQKTVRLCSDMYDEFSSLSSERVFDEFRKLLMLSEYPSIGFMFLRECGWINHFPEIRDMVGCNQNPENHPEGDVYRHTMRVINWAARVKEDLPEDWRLPFMFGALLHDIGKPSTVDEELHCYGHEKVGANMARSFMERLTRDSELIERTVAIVRNHMRCARIFKDRGRRASWKRLHNVLRLDVAGAMSLCDGRSRFYPGYDDDVAREHEIRNTALRYFDEFGEEPIKPILMGRHLIERGMEPGVEFGEILKRAYEYQIEHDIEGSGEEEINILFEKGVSKI